MRTSNLWPTLQIACGEGSGTTPGVVGTLSGPTFIKGLFFERGAPYVNAGRERDLGGDNTLNELYLKIWNQAAAASPPPPPPPIPPPPTKFQSSCFVARANSGCLKRIDEDLNWWNFGS